MSFSYDVHNAPNIKAITPSGSDLSPTPVALYFGTDGTVAVMNQDGTTQADIPVFAGGHLHCQPKRVTAATATVYGYFHLTTS
jgi:hypothetical protein